MAAPTLIAFNGTVYNSFTATKTTASFTWAIGDIFVVIAGSEGFFTLNTPTSSGSGLTFVKNQNINASGNCSAFVATAVATIASSGTISVTNGGTTNDWGISVWQFRASTGVGGSASQATTTKTKALAALGADSAICWAVFDFSGGSVGSGTPTPTDDRVSTLVTGVYTARVFDILDQPSTGSISYGFTGAGAGPFSIVIQEVKAGAGVTGIPYYPDMTRRILNGR